MKSSVQIGFYEWLEGNIDTLAKEYDYDSKDSPEELYACDTGFKDYCHQEWEDVVDAYDTAREYTYN